MENTERQKPVGGPNTDPVAGVAGGVRGWRQTLALFLLLTIFWLLLSGRIGVQYFVFLAFSAGLVLYMNPERPFPGLDPSRGSGISGLVRSGAYLARYLVWLVWNVVVANVHVARIILSPTMPIDPKFMVFRSTLKSDLAKVLVANTTTLTPGTVTIDLVGDRFLVHALTPETATGLAQAAVQNAVGSIFGEDPDPAPEVEWTSSYRELAS